MTGQAIPIHNRPFDIVIIALCLISAFLSFETRILTFSLLGVVAVFFFGAPFDKHINFLRANIFATLISSLVIAPSFLSTCVVFAACSISLLRLCNQRPWFSGIRDPVKFQKQYGSTALVLGASGGMGREFCCELAAAGLNVIAVGRRNKNLLDIKVKLESLYKVQVTARCCDISDDNAVTQLLEETKNLDIGLLIFHLGEGSICPFIHDSTEHLVKIVKLETCSLMRIIHEFACRLLLVGEEELF